MATDDSGNQRVAFEWGNLPMQPNNDRTDYWSSTTHTTPVLGAGDSHAVNGSEWNTFPDFNRLDMQGHTLEGGDAFYWPSIGVCYNNPKTKNNNWQDLIEYMRDCGVDSNRLKEATFVGGDNKYDTNGEYDGGVIFWDYIPADVIIYIDWQTGYVLTGKDFDGIVNAGNYSAGTELSVNPGSDLDISFVAFTNDPNKDTASWWY